MPPIPWLPKQLSLLSRFFQGKMPVWLTGDSEAERILRTIAAAERARLRKGPGPDRHVRDRHARRKSRQLLNSIRKRPVRELPKEVLVARYRPSPILDTLLPEREKHWKPVLRRQEVDNTPAVTLDNFDMLENPSKTLSSLRKIAELEASALQAFLHFGDDYCLDAGAYLVLAEVWPHFARIFHGGRMSSAIQKVLHATNFGENNRMRLRAAERDVDFMIDGKHSDVWAFPLQRRRPAGTSKSLSVHLDPQTREEAVDRFNRWVNEILSVDEINQQLTTKGKGWIGFIIGELLCNAERHSQPGSTDGDWSTTGFMVRRDGELKCYMAFLSVGQSFAESMANAAPELKDKLDAYVRQHWSSGMSAEALTTLFALQDTVTGDPEARAENSGGTGLQDVLEFVEFLAGTHREGSDARVTIVSGNSCIQLRYPYLCGKRRAEDKPRLLWCNAANSIESPPDDGFVQMLEERFAGALVSVAFTLDPEYLASLVETDDEDDQPGSADGRGQGPQPERQVAG